MALVVLVVIVGLSGWVAGNWIRSPADVAAQTSPPDPSVITADVEARVLTSDIITRGTARFGSPREVALTPSIFKDGPAVVTSLPEPGSYAGSGDVLLTVSGRPVFVMAGAVPSYRDLGPGMRGEDVRQLEAALAELDLEAGPVDGIYDDATASAVADLYARSGHEPVVATEDVLDDVRPVAARLVAGARSTAGTHLPADEVVFIAEPPVRVTSLSVSVGDEPEGGLMLVTDAVVAVDSSVPIAEARLLRTGMPVVIDEPDLDIEAHGTVSAVAAGPGTNGQDSSHVYFEVHVDDDPEELVGTSLRLTIPVESTDGEVLAVPVSALTLGADGSTRVERSTPDGVEVVTVDPGLSADGYVEVVPLEGELAVGDAVIIGHDASPGES